VQWSGRCRVLQLTDSVNNPAPDRLSNPIARRSKLFRPYRTFYVRLVAVVLEHQIGDAPDIGLGGSCGGGYRSNLYRRLKK